MQQHKIINLIYHIKIKTRGYIVALLMLVLASYKQNPYEHKTQSRSISLPAVSRSVLWQCRCDEILQYSQMSRCWPQTNNVNYLIKRKPYFYKY